MAIAKIVEVERKNKTKKNRAWHAREQGLGQQPVESFPSVTPSRGGSTPEHRHHQIDFYSLYIVTIESVGNIIYTVVLAREHHENKQHFFFFLAEKVLARQHSLNVKTTPRGDIGNFQRHKHSQPLGRPRRAAFARFKVNLVELVKLLL